MESRVIELRRVRSLSQVVNTAFSFLRLTFKPFFKSQLLIAGPFVLTGAIANSLLRESTQGTIRFGSGHYSPEFISFMAGSVLVLLSYFFLITAMHAFVTLYAASHGIPPTPAEVWRLTRTSLRRTMGVGIYFILFAVLAPLTLMDAVGITFVMFGELAMILLLSGLALLLIYLLVNISVIFIVQVQESLSLSDAFSRCFALVKNHWWQTFGIIALSFAIVAFAIYISILLAVPLSVLHTLIAVDSQVGTVFFILIAAVLSMFFALAVSSLPNIAIAVQYYNLVERKEAVGLRGRTDDLISPEEDPAPEMEL